MADFRSSDRGRKNRSGGDRRSFEGDRRSFGGRDGGSRESFGGSRSGRNFGGDRREGGRDRKELPFCDAICASCGKECKVPFKPTGDKPVYCRACFSKDESHPKNMERAEKSNSSNSGISQEQYKELNKKLDLIIEILTALDGDEDSEE